VAVKKVCTDVLGKLKTELMKIDSRSPSAHRPRDAERMNRYYAERRSLLQGFVDNADLWKLSEVEPVFTSTLRDVNYDWKDGRWLYQNCFYAVTGTFTSEEKKLLVMECCDKERQKFERLKAKFNSEASQEIERERTQIPEEVRIAVWRRDQGKCVRCGSRENLEYDHIVPVSKGGSNTVRNVELLCESCNRQKGNRIQ
jgi:hypothetical protein